MMKKKLRSIVIGGQTFKYIITARVVNNTAKLELKVFNDGSKTHALYVQFHTWDDAIVGYVLNTGVLLFNHRTGVKENYNLNHPARIRQWIEIAVQQGWDGTTNYDIEDGLKELEQLGFEVEWLRPRVG
ncbi:hypothetical protein [Paenibacillus xylanexedens]|uniref:hypothetical protein n=1 Tax=Paenibacillus xylanexedens TaxID=528191 RepID=UPI0011AA5F67|nr:hypothetical protein [Paenibacillus xylanexedens]